MKHAILGLLFLTAFAAGMEMNVTIYTPEDVVSNNDINAGGVVTLIVNGVTWNPQNTTTMINSGGGGIGRSQVVRMVKDGVTWRIYGNATSAENQELVYWLEQHTAFLYETYIKPEMEDKLQQGITQYSSRFIIDMNDLRDKQAEQEAQLELVKGRQQTDANRFATAIQYDRERMDAMQTQIDWLGARLQKDEDKINNPVQPLILIQKDDAINWTILLVSAAAIVGVFWMYRKKINELDLEPEQVQEER